MGGETGLAGMVGAPPVVTQGTGNPEAMKYGKLWEMPQYRVVSPGEDNAQVFLLQARPKSGSHVIDFGCGTGRGALQLALAGLSVTMVDFVRNCLDDDIRQMLDTQSQSLRFVKADLEKALPVSAEYGYCVDVLEHIPPEKVDTVIGNILLAAQHVFFSIALYEDACGDLIGERLHLTLQPYEWWLEKFRSFGCLIHYSECVGSDGLQHHANFYVSAWQDAQGVVDHGIINTPLETIREHVATNISGGWQQATPHQTNDLEVMILGGAPSMAAFEDDIKAKRADGVKLVTLNGAYNWALDHGLTPSATIIVDAREFNARFTKPVVDDCKYLIASQCHPTVLEGLPHDRTYLWHTSTEAIKDILDGAFDHWWPIPGGSTVLLRAIPLLRMLGYRKFHLYGCDSCLTDTAHHAYAQPENDSECVLNISVTGGRIFRCHPWMASQAQEMINLIKAMGDQIELAIYGDGLLSHILHTGAQLAMDEGKGE